MRWLAPTCCRRVDCSPVAAQHLIVVAVFSGPRARDARATGETGMENREDEPTARNQDKATILHSPSRPSMTESPKLTPPGRRCRLPGLSVNWRRPRCNQCREDSALRRHALAEANGSTDLVRLLDERAALRWARDRRLCPEPVGLRLDRPSPTQFTSGAHGIHIESDTIGAGH